MRCEAVDDNVMRLRWEREQTLLGLAPGTPDEELAVGGLAALAIPPTVRICVLPGDPDAVAVPPQDPATVIPQLITVPCGRQLPRHAMVRGTSSGYVGVSYAGEDGLWRCFAAVRWHGGVDFFLGDQGGREWDIPAAAFRRRVVYLQIAVCWAWAAFDLQREMVERFTAGGPFRAIVAVAHTSGASLGTFGAGCAEPGRTGFWDQPTAVDQHVLLLEDLAEWPDAVGVEALALPVRCAAGPSVRRAWRTPSGPDRSERREFRPRW